MPFPSPQILLKSPTGIVGFDQITDGSVPHGPTTLLVGGPGSGKTILAAQFLVHGDGEFERYVPLPFARPARY